MYEIPADETQAEELGRLRRELSEWHYDTPEHRDILDRIAVLVRELAVARREDGKVAAQRER